jgi:hypothetical protein
VALITQISVQSKGVELLSGTVQHTQAGHLERRRPGRRGQVSPQLISLLREADKIAVHSEAAERLSPALAMVVIASCSATLWFGIIRTATWLLG